MLCITDMELNSGEELAQNHVYKLEKQKMKERTLKDNSRRPKTLPESTPLFSCLLCTLSPIQISPSCRSFKIPSLFPTHSMPTQQLVMLSRTLTLFLISPSHRLAISLPFKHLHDPRNISTRLSTSHTNSRIRGPNKHPLHFSETITIPKVNFKTPL